MPAPTKKSPTNLQRLRDMHAKGASDREIGEAIGIGHTTIARWREDLGLGVVGGAGPRSTRPRVTTTAEVREAAQEAAARLAEASAPPPAGDGAVDVLQRRLASVRASLDRLGPAVERDEYPAPAFRALGAYERELVASIAELTPPVPLDPEHDPANQEAAALVRQRLTRLVSVAEASTRCCHCGRPPYPPEGAGR